METNKRLDILFEEWEKILPEYQNNFRKDGIINENLFEEKGNTKILFICKEPNGRNHKNNDSYDFREEWDNEQNFPKYSFAYRIAEWAWGIQNNFIPFCEIDKNREKQKNSLRKIAFMNVKKSAGIGKSNTKTIREHIKTCHNFILDEINIIQPEIIILGLSFDKSIRKILFDNLKMVNSNYNIHVAKWGNCKIVDFYHPSSLTPPAASYSLLQNVFQSSIYKNL